ncbi:MAG TPA: hypothetical protein VKB25_01320 [Conexibacter sp.]|nr:hypothetical protein [Conexibacter sp.]
MAVLTAERIVERPPSLFGPAPVRHAPAAGDLARERDGGLGGGLTLDDAIVGAWEGLAAQVVVQCLVCGGPLHPDAAPDAVGGHCGDCSTTLD